MGLETANFISDLVIANPDGTDQRSEGDNHVRMLKTVLQNTFPGFSGRFNRWQTKSGAFSPALNDSHSIFECTTGFTATPVAAATLGNGWVAAFYTNGGAVTIDPNGAELINGQTTLIVPDKTLAIVYCSGTAFIASFSSVNTLVSSPAQITSNQNDYATSGAKTLRINSDARRNVTGLASGTDGRELTVMNVGTFPIVFTYEDASSTAANRLAFGCTLGGGQVMRLVYDTTSSRWRAVNIPEPLGTVKEFASGVLEAGFLQANANYSRTTYASLFNMTGTTFGVGDGSTTFGLFLPGAIIASGTPTHSDSGTDADVVLASDTLAVPSNLRKWITGKSAVFALASGTITGLTSGNTYFVIRNSATTVKLASTLINAQNGTAIDLTAKSTPVWSITHTAEARTHGEQIGEDDHAQSTSEVGPHTHSTPTLQGGAGSGLTQQSESAFSSTTTNANTAGVAMNNTQLSTVVLRGVRYA